MHPKFINIASTSASRNLDKPAERPAPLLRFPTVLPGVTSLPTRSTADSLAIQEAVERLMNMSLDQDQSSSSSPTSQMTPSLIRGFRATVPSSELPKQRRRMLRGGLVDEDFSGAKIGLKRLGDRARGLLTIEEDGENGSENGLGVGRRQKKRKARRSEAKRLEEKLHLEDLVKQADEIAQDKENLNVRTVSQLARLICPRGKLTQWLAT